MAIGARHSAAERSECLHSTHTKRVSVPRSMQEFASNVRSTSGIGSIPLRVVNRIVIIDTIKYDTAK